jgi:hypothetical protein
MLKLIAVASPALLAATMAVGATASQSTQVRGQQPASPTTVIGCVVRNGDVDVDKGTRVLDLKPGALALTNARITSGSSSSATRVPGTEPQDRDSGTIPQRTIVGGRPAEPDTLSFALTGERLTGLGDMVGRRVEIVGRIAPLKPSTGDQPRATTGTNRDAAPVAGGGTREERPGERTAHPSAELQTLDVVSFRSVTGACE